MTKEMNERLILDALNVVVKEPYPPIDEHISISTVQTITVGLVNIFVSNASHRFIIKTMPFTSREVFKISIIMTT